MAADKNPFKSDNSLKAFFMVHRKITERLPATIWIFENDAYADSFVLCDSDVQYPNECIPAANLWKYSCTNRNAPVQEVKQEVNQGSNKTNSEKNEVHFVSVRKKDARKLLRHLLIIKHLRIEIFRFNSSLFEKVKKASPSDLPDVKEILFGDDGEAEYSEILRLGPICSLHLAGDIR